MPFRFVDPPTVDAARKPPRGEYSWPLLRVKPIESKGGQLGVVASHFIERGLLIPYTGVYTNGSVNLTDSGEDRSVHRRHSKKGRSDPANKTHQLGLHAEKARGTNEFFVDGSPDLPRVRECPAEACVAARINEAGPGERYNCSYSTHAAISLLAGADGPPRYPLYPNNSAKRVAPHDGFVIVCANVQAGEELLVWYGQEYVRRGYSPARFTCDNIKEPDTFRNTLVQLRCYSDAVTRAGVADFDRAALDEVTINRWNETLNALGGPVRTHSQSAAARQQAGGGGEGSVP